MNSRYIVLLSHHDGSGPIQAFGPYDTEAQGKTAMAELQNLPALRDTGRWEVLPCTVTADEIRAEVNEVVQNGTVQVTVAFESAAETDGGAAVTNPNRPFDRWVIEPNNLYQHTYKINPDYGLNVWDLDVTVHDSTGAEVTPDRFEVDRELTYKLTVLPAEDVSYPVTVTLWRASERGCGKP
jgi:hypothetical protein